MDEWKLFLADWWRGVELDPIQHCFSFAVGAAVILVAFQVLLWLL